MEFGLINIVLPETNLFLLRESRYPDPTSSISTPERVLPSVKNWTARVAGIEGPSESSNFALREPEPHTHTNHKNYYLNTLTFYIIPILNSNFVVYKNTKNCLSNRIGIGEFTS